MQACLDVIQPPRQHAERIALVRAKMWQPGDRISVSFTGGSPAVRDRVRGIATSWEEFADVEFSFRSDGHGDVRVAFDPGPSWSAVGRDCLIVSPGRPTMNLGWLGLDTADAEYSRVVLHEFGHVLGCVHEHQHPAAGIRWKREAVYAAYTGAPNFWSADEVDRNVFRTYSKSISMFSAADPASIMMYPIPAEWTEDGFSVGLNAELSETDKTFIRALYS